MKYHNIKNFTGYIITRDLDFDVQLENCKYDIHNNAILFTSDKGKNELFQFWKTLDPKEEQSESLFIADLNNYFNSCGRIVHLTLNDLKELLENNASHLKQYKDGM